MEIVLVTVLVTDASTESTFEELRACCRLNMTTTQTFQLGEAYHFIEERGCNEEWYCISSGNYNNEALDTVKESLQS